MGITPHQEIFKPRPKVFSTPLNPIKPDKIITPLSGKQADAVEAQHQQESVQPEHKDRNRSRKAAEAGSGNRLLREAPGSQEEVTP